MGMWLGNIFWWTAASEGTPSRVRPDELEAWVAELKLEAPSMPAPKSAHVFRAASGHLARKYIDDSGNAAELEIKEVSATNHFIVRHVIKTMTDPRTQTLTHDKVAQLKFYRPTRTAKGRRPGSEVSQPSLKPGLAGLDAENVLALVEDFRTEYATRTEFLSMAALRRVIRDFVLIRCDGVLIRPAGGLYFVEERHTDALQRLERLIARFGPEASSHTIPLIDTPSQRSLVSDGVADGLVSECRALVETLSKEYATYLARKRAVDWLQRLRRLQRHYAEMLAFSSDNLVKVKAAMGEASAAVAFVCLPDGSLGHGRQPGWSPDLPTDVSTEGSSSAITTG